LLKESKFDVVLMDLQMPVLDGLRATAAIRKEEISSQRHLPIIAMTAHAMQGERERCLEAGMDAYISKPVQENELIAMVEEIAQSNSASPPKPTTITAAADFEPAEALERVQGDEELLADLVEVFLKDCPGQLVNIRKLIEQGDLQGIERAAHSFKGSVGNFTTRGAFSMAFDLEKTAHRGDLAQCARLYNELEAEIETLKPELMRLGRSET
jgi:two-component system sensor histidine kinase/response regulator